MEALTAMQKMIMIQKFLHSLVVLHHILGCYMEEEKNKKKKDDSLCRFSTLRMLLLN